MKVGKQIERRRLVRRALRLGQPLFMEVPKAKAASFLAACTLLAIFADALHIFAFAAGSIFLLICAFAAWFVGNRYALLLGTFIVSVQYSTTLLLNLHALRIDQVIDFSFQLACSSAVVFMLGVARVALELEWRLARIDPLTGALNRKAFFDIVESAKQSNDLVVLVFADLNGLKRVNDEFGHKHGDEAIKKFAERVRSSIRQDDIFARVGGDEFIIYLHVNDLTGAHTVIDRLHNRINLQPAGHTDITCSLGVLLLPTGSNSIDSELRKADLLMYEAKRNQVGYSMAILADPDQSKLVRIASGIDPAHLSTASVRSRSRNSVASAPVQLANGPLAA